jgi:hypothetical protein
VGTCEELKGTRVFGEDMEFANCSITGRFGIHLEFAKTASLYNVTFTDCIGYVNFITFRDSFILENASFINIIVYDNRTTESACTSAHVICPSSDNALIKANMSIISRSQIGNVAGCVFRDITVFNQFTRFKSGGTNRGQPTSYEWSSSIETVVPCLFKMQQLEGFYITDTTIDSIRGSYYTTSSDTSAPTDFTVSSLQPDYAALSILRTDGNSNSGGDSTRVEIRNSLITNIVRQTNLFTFLRPDRSESIYHVLRSVSVSHTVFRHIEVIDAFYAWHELRLTGCSFDDFRSENIFTSLWEVEAFDPVVDCRFHDFYTRALFVVMSSLSYSDMSYTLTQCDIDSVTVVMASYSQSSYFRRPYILQQCSLRNTNWHIALRSTYCTTFGEEGLNMSFEEWHTYGTSVIAPMAFTSSVFHTTGNSYVTSYTATVLHTYTDSCRVGTDPVLSSWLGVCGSDTPFPVCGSESSVKESSVGESYVEAFLPSSILTSVSSAHPSLSRASTPKSVTAVDPGSSGGKGLSGAVIGAISCGVIVAVCVVAFIIVRVVKKKKPGRSSLEEFSDSSPPSHESIPSSDDVVVTPPSPLPPPVHKSPPIVQDSVTMPPPPPPPPVPKSPLLVDKSPPPKSPPPKSSPMSSKGVPPPRSPSPESFSVAGMIKTLNG